MKIEAIRKLNDIKCDLRVVKDKKGHLGNAYRNLEDIFKAVNPLLKAADALLVMEEDVVTKENILFLECHATLYIEEEEIKTKTYLRIDQELRKGISADQQSGASLAYGRKYLLGALFCIDDGRDSDSIAASTPPKVAAIKQAAAKDRLLNGIKQGAFKQVRTLNAQWHKEKKLTDDEAAYISDMVNEAEEKAQSQEKPNAKIATRAAEKCPSIEEMRHVEPKTSEDEKSAEKVTTLMETYTDIGKASG